jgi:hypothetical protein
MGLSVVSLSYFLGFLVVISLFSFSAHFLLSHQFTQVLDGSFYTALHGIRIPHCRY